MNSRLDASRARQRRPLPRRRRGAGDAAALDHRPRGRRPADLQRGRHASPSSRTARSTTTASCARELERRGHRFATASRHRGPGPPLRGARRRASSSACAGCSRSRSGTGASGACSWPATASGSSRSTTASPTARSSFASELKAMLEQPGFSRADRPAGRRRLPRLQLDPGAADDLRRGAQAAGRQRWPSGATAS